MVFDIGMHVFVNRGYDIVQRGKICATTVTTRAIEDDKNKDVPRTEVSVTYDVKFPFPATTRCAEDDDIPFPRITSFSSDLVYRTLEEAFHKKHNIVGIK